MLSRQSILNGFPCTPKMAQAACCAGILLGLSLGCRVDGMPHSTPSTPTAAAQSMALIQDERLVCEISQGPRKLQGEGAATAAVAENPGTDPIVYVHHDGPSRVLLPPCSAAQLQMSASETTREQGIVLEPVRLMRCPTPPAFQICEPITSRRADAKPRWACSNKNERKTLEFMPECTLTNAVDANAP